MKRPLLHILIAVAAGAVGWYCGSAPPADEVSGPRIASRTDSQPAAKIPGRAATAWAAQIIAVRSVPGAASEIAWIKWAMAIPDADIPAAIARLNPKSDFHALRFLYARWVKLDAPAAWASFRKSEIPARISHFYLSERRESGSGGMVSSSLQEDPRSMIAARMLASWMTVDPAAARAFGAKLAVKGSPEAKEVPIHAYYLNEALGEDPDKVAASPEQLAGAATEALKREAGNERTSALADAARKWMAADANAACEWLRALSIEDRKDLWRYDFNHLMGSASPAVRAATQLSLLEARGLEPQFLTIYTDPSRQGIETMHETSGLKHAAETVQDWIAQDPVAAQKWLASQPDNDLKAVLTGEAAGALVKSDVNAGIALLNQTGGDQQLAIKAFMNRWMETDARACIQWAGRIEDAAARDGCMESAALSLSVSDPALALTTARSLPDAAARQRVFATVSRSLTWNPTALQNMQGQFPGSEWNVPVK